MITLQILDVEQDLHVHLLIPNVTFVASVESENYCAEIDTDIDISGTLKIYSDSSIN